MIFDSLMGMIDRFVTDLPDPDSPTMPSVSPRLRSKLTPSTAFAVRFSSSNQVRRSRTESSGATLAFSHLRVERVAQTVADKV